jgi:chemotaxis protein CheY-P-specific phosphatase CheC
LIEENRFMPNPSHFAIENPVSSRPDPAILGFVTLLSAAFDKAAGHLSTLTQRTMAVINCRIESMTVEDFEFEIEALEDRLFFVSILKMKDTLHTDVVFLIAESEGLRLFDTISGHPAGTPREVTADVISGIGEVNNILGSAFIDQFAKRIGRAVHPRIPVNTYDMLGAILQGVVLQDEYLDRTVICADAVIREAAADGFNVRLIVLSDQTQLLRLLDIP